MTDDPLRNRPTIAPQLVMTRKDFRESVSRKRYFYERLGDLSWDCSIVFIGFQAQREESDDMLSYVEDVYNRLMDISHTPFRPFAVLPHLTGRKKQELEDAGLTPLEGSFEDFIKAANEIIFPTGTVISSGSRSPVRDIVFTVQGRKFYISKGELEQYSTQFFCLHDNIREDLRIALKDTPNTKIAEIWKSDPHEALIAGDYYIKRDNFPDLVDRLKRLKDQIVNDKSAKVAAQIMWVVGKRGSGKSTVAHQLAWYAYFDLGLPTIILSRDATYAIENSPGVSIEISGWNEQQVDKFLSLPSSHEEEDSAKIVPIILADNLIHRANALERLLHYLEEHKKPSILIMTISEEELGIAQQEGLLGGVSRYITRLRKIFSGNSTEIDHKLSDDEINRLFEVVARVDSRILGSRDRLIWLAKDNSYCDRDFLLILYTWFDSRFRKFDEIIADEIAILEQDDKFKRLYLATAVFHRYHFQPRLALCAKAIEMSNEEYSSLRQNPLFKALITVHQPEMSVLQEIGATRHVEFSRRIVGLLVSDINEQIDLMAKVLAHCGQVDRDFARGFMNYLYDFGLSLIPEQIQKLKEATEEGLADDFVLNHQFAAYLIRENLDLTLARYYLDLADSEFPGNTSIIHSVGNLCFRKYRELLPIDPPKAREYFEMAREYFARSRNLQFGEEEHGYYTEIDMLNYRLGNEADTQNVKATIEAERHALLFEALRVVPKARQNLLRGHLGVEKPFNKLPSNEQTYLKGQILAGEASPILLEYYGRSLLEHPNTITWNNLRILIETYWAKASSDFPTAVILCLLAKRAFIKNAQTRFQLLQTYYEDTIQYNETDINFVLLAEYTRLLMTDAFVLGRFNFLRSSVADIIELYRNKKPRFLGDEYILTDLFYRFNENKADQGLNLFQGFPTNIWTNSRNAQRFRRTAFIPSVQEDRFVKIELDNITGYFVRAPRQEISTSGKAILNFVVKYAPDGFFATDFIT